MQQDRAQGNPDYVIALFTTGGEYPARTLKAQTKQTQSREKNGFPENFFLPILSTHMRQAFLNLTNCCTHSFGAKTVYFIFVLFFCTKMTPISFPACHKYDKCSISFKLNWPVTAVKAMRITDSLHQRPERGGG